MNIWCLTAFAKDTYSIAQEHGWHDKAYSDLHWSSMMVTELCEAIQAERENKHTTKKAISDSMNQAYPSGPQSEFSGNLTLFEESVKNTVEEELADFVIRVCDFTALKGEPLLITLMNYKAPFKTLSLTELVAQLLKYLPDVKGEGETLTEKIQNLGIAVSMVHAYLLRRGFNLLDLILLKQEYNKTRAYKHNNKLF